MYQAALFWLALMVFFIILEANTVTLISIWFAVGALAASITALLSGPIWLQTVLFFAVSALLMVSFCVYMIIDKSEEAENGAKDYITLTSADSSAAKQSGRKTHKSSAADSENKSIPSK